MKKGFTLIELLAVIIILGILGVVIIPKIGDSITSSKEKAYLAQVESIKKGVYDFLIDNGDIMLNNDTIALTLGVVKQGGYLPVEIKNPITRKSFSNESGINVTKVNNTYNIELNLIDVENYNETIDSNSPIIVLNGDYIEYVEVNSEYEELGATAKDYTGQQINVSAPQYFLEDVSQTGISTNTIKTYTAVYTVTDSSGNRSSATRTIVVRDTTAPTIIVPDTTTLNISEVAGYDLKKDLVVYDNYDNTLDKTKVTVSSTLASRVGKYLITYTVTDNSGNTTNIRRIITVDDEFDKYYTRVEYIESTGTQYIDTNVIANQNTGFDIDFISYNKISQTADEFGTIFGARTNYRTNGYQLTTYNNTSLLGHFLFGTNDSYANIRYSAEIIPGTRQQISFRNRVLTLPDNTTTTVTNYTFETPSPLTIFALNQNGSIAEYSKTKLYNLKIYDGDTLIRNFIPCYRNSDNEVGLYDLVNNKFYTNSGTGKFEYNKDFNDKYVKLNYIESTGTQYIDSQYIVTPNTGVETTFQFTDASTTQQRIFGVHTNDESYLTYTFYISYRKDFAFAFKDGTGNWSGVKAADTDKHNLQFNTKKGYLVFDNTTELSLGSSPTKKSLNSLLILTAANESGTIMYYAKAKLYSFKIYESGTLVRDLIPAMRKSDSAAGMYDTINDAFYTNNGTGEFIKGNSIN